MDPAGAVMHDLHRLGTLGPRDLEIAWAMSAHGYDAIKWAEGQGVLAELVSSDLPAQSSLVAARAWYREAATAAQQALVTEPRLLAKLRLAGEDADRPMRSAVPAAISPTRF